MHEFIAAKRPTGVSQCLGSEDSLFRFPVPSVLLLSLCMFTTDIERAFAGEALAERAGCMACHSVSGSGLGPSYEEIASRYRGETTARILLSEKLVTGGGGNWTYQTGGLSMPPYSNLLSSEEIRALVVWILGLEAGNDKTQ